MIIIINYNVELAICCPADTSGGTHQNNVGSSNVSDDSLKLWKSLPFFFTVIEN